MRYILIFLFLIAGINVSTFSQKKNFSTDPLLFPEELELKTVNPSKEQEKYIKQFGKDWEEGIIYSPEIKEEIIKFSNELINRRARVNPHIINFIKCYMSFIEKQHDILSFKEWKRGLSYIISNPEISIIRLESFLSSSYSLINDNALYSSQTTQWVVSPNTYRFEFTGDNIIINVNNTRVVCYSIRDSIDIIDTKGTFFPLNAMWEGNGGIVTWERAGYNSKDVYASLRKYSINMQRAEYEADSVIMTNRIFFGYDLFGKLSDKVKNIQSKEYISYPKFISYNNDFEIDDMYKDISYLGGLSFEGAKLVGTSNNNELAKLWVYRNDTIILESRSNYYVFKKDRLDGIDCEIRISLGNDSIFHPSVKLTYFAGNRTLRLSKTAEFTSQCSYFDSYHMWDINFDEFRWNIDEDEFYFTMFNQATSDRTFFESANYFSLKDFEKLMGMEQQHPLILLHRYSSKYMTKVIDIESYADYLKKPVEQVKRVLFDLALKGYIFYDKTHQTITIRDKTINYLKSSIGAKDYDVINFISKTEAPLENAVFDIKTYDLTVNGVKQIFLSDSQYIKIIPKDQQIICKQNRSFSFDGTIHAGLQSFYGSNFFFRYDSFKINMFNIDSMQIRFIDKETDELGYPLVYNAENLIEEITGVLFIDKHTNKSGLKPYKQYPIFQSNKSSHVYYDKPETYKGIYNRNRFYFELEPFTLMNLDLLKKEELSFNGKFVSAGIFPDLQKSLTIQNDNSLGLNEKTPPEGLPAYGGKATFNNSYTLTNRGLRGDGDLKYLTSVSKSRDFIFFPDSTNGLAYNFNIGEKATEVQYPMVRSVDDSIHYEPYNDILIAKDTKVPFTMFSDTVNLKGKLRLKPSGLSGEGQMDLKVADLISENYTFKHKEINSVHSDFFLKSYSNNQYTILTHDVITKIDFNQRKGWFNANNTDLPVEFPQNKYICYASSYLWNMPARTLNLTYSNESEIDTSGNANTSDGLKGPRYISVLKSQDSLSFMSPMVYYDYEKNIINASGVKYIRVADVNLYPANSKVTVRTNAAMDKFTDSRIEANYITKYHNIYDVSVAVAGRYSYAGQGTIDYVTSRGTVYPVFINYISVDENKKTIGTSTIAETDSFRLGPKYEYFGKIKLTAENKFHEFDGTVKVDYKCNILNNQWVRFKSVIDPYAIYIPVSSEPVNIDRSPLYSGVFISGGDSLHTYPAFLSDRKYYRDTYMSTADGYLYYDSTSSLYKISSMEKLQNFNAVGNYLYLQDYTCKMYSEGEIFYGVDYGLFKIKSYGSIVRDENEDKTKIDALMALDFFFEQKALIIFANDLDSAGGAGLIDFMRPAFEKRLAEFITTQKATQLKSELLRFGKYRNIPDQMKVSIMLSDIKLIWNHESKTFRACGNVGFSNIGNNEINKAYKCFLEITKKRNNDNFDFFIQITPNLWYYFAYTKGVMHTLSSNVTYNNHIKSLKAKSRRPNDSNRKNPYIFILATREKFNKFLKTYNSVATEEY